MAATLAAPRRSARARSASDDAIGRPVSADRIASWRERLPADDAALVERVAAPYLERFGYLPVCDGAVGRAALAAVARQRRIRRSRLRRSALREASRRLVLDRRPVAAEPGSGAVG